MQSEILGVEKPLISVIIPVYNVEKYLCRCVDSVLAQTYPKLEIILVDDGATDNSGKMCDAYAQKDTRIKVIHKPNGGLSAARNSGIEQAKGDFLSFIDSDDWIAPEFIETLYCGAVKHHTKVSCVSYYWVENTGITPQTILDGKTAEKIISADSALEMGFNSLGFFAWNKLYHHEFFEHIRFPENKLFEDMATIYKVFLQTDLISVTDKPLYYYNRLNTGSITKSSFSVKKLDYFWASGEILAYAKKSGNTSLRYIIERERAYHIAGFFRQMAQAHFEDTAIIRPLQRELRRHIIKLLLSRHKLTNKLFALVCCVNFNWAAAIYRKIGM